jgi:lysophospholipid acyltransferase (LPLAT)-like uncharacterized protein
MLRRVVKHPAVQRAGIGALGLYLDFALRTTRWTLDGESHVAPHIAGAPAVVAFWHERLPLMPMLWLIARQRGAPKGVHVLVSRHRDGRLIGALVRRFRVGVVHGSSSRGGPAGLRTLAGLLGGGYLVAITPDGPRGPRRRAAPGVAQLAELAAVPVLPCAAQTTRRITLATWDGMVLPLPFGRGVIVCAEPIRVGRDEWQTALPAIEAALDAAANRANRLCAR